MILLPKEFAERTDGCELLHYREVEFVENKFVPKKGHFHLFERSYANENRRHDRSVHSYEIFLASRHAKGSERYGKVYDDDTEYYPGKSYFGRGLAKCCGRLDLAQNYLQEIIEKCRKNQLPIEQEEEEEIQVKIIHDSKAAVSDGRRGRKALDASGIVYPNDNFTLVEFAELNAGKYSQSYLYVHLRGLVDAGKFAVVTALKKENQRGKPTLVYGRK